MEYAFLKEIERWPDDENLKLVYADWLDEQGDIRGQILRLSCELRKLLSEHQLNEQWLQALKVREFPVPLKEGAVLRCEIQGWPSLFRVREVAPHFHQPTFEVEVNGEFQRYQTGVTELMVLLDCISPPDGERSNSIAG